jgi:diguanylate cyclase (GGDEF)-like protein
MRHDFIISFWANRPKWLLLGIGTVALILIGVGDYFASSRLLEFSVFFVLPVSFLTWFVDQRAGLAGSACSAGIILIVALHSPRQTLGHQVAYWNSLIWLMFLLLITFLVAHLKVLHVRERELARVDDLTKVATRLALYEFAEVELNRARRFQLPMTLAYIDLDSFKEVNDRNGHAAGDRVLITVARHMRRSIRQTDLVARMGGDEFALMLPNTGTDAALAVLDKLLTTMSRSMHLNRWPVTFSVGVVTFLNAPDSVDQMVQRADEIMYSVKQAGKNHLRQEEIAA